MFSIGIKGCLFIQLFICSLSYFFNVLFDFIGFLFSSFCLLGRSIHLENYAASLVRTEHTCLKSHRPLYAMWKYSICYLVLVCLSGLAEISLGAFKLLEHVSFLQNVCLCSSLRFLLRSIFLSKRKLGMSYEK